MDKKILIRYGEIFLKGRNRKYFINLLFNNIEKALKEFKCELKIIQGRFILENYSEADENAITKILCKVAGIYSISHAVSIPTDFENIKKIASDLAKEKGTFKVQTKRADKTFNMKSMDVSMEIGGYCLENNSNLKVDVHNPDFVLNIEIREDGNTYLYKDEIDGIKGMPVGSAGKGLLMLSGGLDSPVAGYLMLRRGMTIDAIHFHSYPYTSEMAKEKVIDLAKKLTVYGGNIHLHVVPFTDIQMQIHSKCDSTHLVTLMRRFMIRIAEKIARKVEAGAIITGESLGQVASQTLSGIISTDDAVNLPVFRPLIATDKTEIMDIARQIDTYDISILPYEDCCTIFLPENPVIKPKLEKVWKMEEALDIETLVNTAVENTEVIKL